MSSSQPGTRRQRLGDWAALSAVVLGLAAHVGEHSAWPLGAALVVLPMAWRACARTLRWACLLALAAATLAAGIERWPVRTVVALRPDPDLALAEAEQRYLALSGALQQAAARAAREPALRPALSGDPAALAPLFAALEAQTESVANRPALAVLRSDWTPLAWSGRISDLARAPSLAPGHDGLVVREDRLSTSLLAIFWLRDAGRLWGAVVAEHPVARRQTLRTRPGPEVDELIAGLPGVEIEYLDPREPPPDDGPSLRQPAAEHRRVLRGPDGRALAVLRAEAVTLPPSSDTAVLLWPLLLLSSLPFGIALAALAGRRALLRPEALVVSGGLRLLWGLGDARWPQDAADALSPATFGSTTAAPLFATPLDLLLTILLLAHASALLLALALRASQRPPSGLRLALGGLLALAVTALTFAGLQAGMAHAGPPVETFSLSPLEPTTLFLQMAAFAWMLTGFCWLLALLVATGPVPEGPARRVGLLAVWVAAGWLASLGWPRSLGLPLLPSLGLLLLALALTAARGRWQPWLARAGALPRAGMLLACVALGGLLLQPALAHYAEKILRQRVAREYAPLLARQDDWQAYLLERTCEQIDALHVLEPEAGAARPPDAQQLAFAVWSATDLAGFGVSSAIELFDAAGEPLSRFALNLPALPQPHRAAPAGGPWSVVREQLSLGSSTREVLSAWRELRYLGQLQGTLRVHIAEDYAALPFLPQRDPYAPLYRPTPTAQAQGERELVLLVYAADRSLRFSNAEQPLGLPPDVEARLDEAQQGFWVTLPLDGRSHHVYLVRGPRDRLYALAYPRLDAARFAADTLEAASVLLVLVASPLFLVLGLRSLLGRSGFSLGSLREAVGRRFGLRLFAAFVALAVVPVAVLQTIVRSFVRERLLKQAEEQALDRANVAQKAVQDYASFQRDQPSPPQPVTDTALQWIASLIRSDLDLFEAGRLRATSKRELYASGLLPTRVDGSLYRSLVLEGRPRVISPSQVGGLVFRIVSVPVRLGTRELGILSVPLEERPQQLEHVLADLERGLRVASALLFVAAALLAQSMARRISGPLREVSRATRQLAAGDLETRVHTSSRDELLELVDSFNQMAADLAQQRQDLERSNRLAAWAEMARQVAHEVKNPLTPIQLSAEHLRRVYGDGRVDFARALETCTDTILRQVRSLRSIVTEFSAYARPPVGGGEALDVAALIETVVSPYREALPPDVRLELDCPAGLPSIQGERRLLERALVNLLENALQAIGGAGKVRLSAKATARGLELVVEDSGPGVDPSVRDRLFEPFFSTKTGGSGLGLALVKKIVEDLGGSVQLSSRPGCTQVVVHLPAAGASAGAPRA